MGIKERYGNTQVRELIFSPADLVALAVENFLGRGRLSYDFQYDRPIVIWDNGTLHLRFIQKQITADADERGVFLSPLAVDKS